MSDAENFWILIKCKFYWVLASIFEWFWKYFIGSLFASFSEFYFFKAITVPKREFSNPYMQSIFTRYQKDLLSSCQDGAGGFIRLESEIANRLEIFKGIIYFEGNWSYLKVFCIISSSFTSFTSYLLWNARATVRSSNALLAPSRL